MKPKYQLLQDRFSKYKELGELAELGRTTECLVLLESLENIVKALKEIERQLCAKKSPEKVLWKFNWLGGGQNSVWAHSKENAVAEIKMAFPSGRWTADEKSLTPLITKSEREAYWKSLPLMD